MIPRPIAMYLLPLLLPQFVLRGVSNLVAQTLVITPFEAHLVPFCGQQAKQRQEYL